jgi:hypothetical protein
LLPAKTLKSKSKKKKTEKQKKEKRSNEMTDHMDEKRRKMIEEGRRLLAARRQALSPAPVVEQEKQSEKEALMSRHVSAHDDHRRHEAERSLQVEVEERAHMQYAETDEWKQRAVELEKQLAANDERMQDLSRECQEWKERALREAEARGTLESERSAELERLKKECQELKANAANANVVDDDVDEALQKECQEWKQRALREAEARGTLENELQERVDRAFGQVKEMETLCDRANVARGHALAERDQLAAQVAELEKLLVEQGAKKAQSLLGMEEVLDERASQVDGWKREVARLKDEVTRLEDELMVQGEQYSLLERAHEQTEQLLREKHQLVSMLRENTERKLAHGSIRLRETEHVHDREVVQLKQRCALMHAHQIDLADVNALRNFVLASRDQIVQQFDVVRHKLRCAAELQRKKQQWYLEQRQHFVHKKLIKEDVDEAQGNEETEEKAARNDDDDDDGDHEDDEEDHEQELDDLSEMVELQEGKIFELLEEIEALESHNAEIDVENDGLRNRLGEALEINHELLAECNRLAYDAEMWQRQQQFSSTKSECAIDINGSATSSPTATSASSAKSIRQPSLLKQASASAPQLQRRREPWFRWLIDSLFGIDTRPVVRQACQDV